VITKNRIPTYKVTDELIYIHIYILYVGRYEKLGQDIIMWKGRIVNILLYIMDKTIHRI